jgi:hypothetical protein
MNYKKMKKLYSSDIFNIIIDNPTIPLLGSDKTTEIAGVLNIKAYLYNFSCLQTKNTYYYRDWAAMIINDVYGVY